MPNQAIQDPKKSYKLPQVETLLQDPSFIPFIEKISRPIVIQILRESLDKARQDPSFDKGYSQVNVMQIALEICQKYAKYPQSSVINATGIAVHTNLGRSPIHPKLWQQVTDVNTGYTNLELDLTTGKREMRLGLVPKLIQAWVGAQDSLVVNNNAAAVYLVLMSLAQGREVIVSRGEQVQIGGGFRIPDILRQSGCTLVEVGTTNITTAQDYFDAVTENTAAILVVHQSNFSMQGFTESADLKALRQGLPQDVALIIDQGSGLSDETFAKDEKSISYYLSQGADLVCFSGDKIFGGVQSGIIAGHTPYIQKISKHPIMRTMRASRLVLSLLEAQLVHKLNQSPVGTGIAQQVIENIENSNSWAKQLAQKWQSYVELIEVQTQVGGGSLPNDFYPSLGLALKSSVKKKIQTHLDNLRNFPIPIIAYLHQDKLIFNLSTILTQHQSIFEQQIESYFEENQDLINYQELKTNQSFNVNQE